MNNGSSQGIASGRAQSKEGKGGTPSRGGKSSRVTRGVKTEVRGC